MGINIVYNGENDPRAFKDILGQQIPALAEKDENIVYLDADLMSCIGTAKWAVANPTRGINCGIAEANMAGVAAGMAAVGFKPIIHTFGPFASRRMFDQVFLSAGYTGNDMTIIGSDPGVTAAFNGGTHMPFEDVALYRSIPTATVIDVSDPNVLVSVLEECQSREGVKYIRVPRKNAAKLYEDGTTLPIGKGVVIREGKDAVVFATGIMIHEAMKAANVLAEEGIEISVIDMFTIKPLDNELVLEYAKKTGAVVTAENHNKIGGLYSAVSELLVSECPMYVECVAVEDIYGQVGPQDYLQEVYGLTASNVVEKVKKAISKK